MRLIFLSLWLNCSIFQYFNKKRHLGIYLFLQLTGNTRKKSLFADIIANIPWFSSIFYPFQQFPAKKAPTFSTLVRSNWFRGRPWIPRLLARVSFFRCCCQHWWINTLMKLHQKPPKKAKNKRFLLSLTNSLNRFLIVSICWWTRRSRKISWLSLCK